jgi:putative tricarboxylic transport membrane protein
MRRDTFLKSLAALAAAGMLPSPAWAAANLKMMIPANPGGGWDSTGRALGKALQEAGVASSVSYDNKGGAAGAIGLAQFVNANKGDPNAMLTMGAVMLGGIILGKPPVSLSQATPLARITSECNVFVLPADSKLKTMKDVVDRPGHRGGDAAADHAEGRPHSLDDLLLRHLLRRDVRRLDHFDPAQHAR